MRRKKFRISRKKVAQVARTHQAHTSLFSCFFSAVSSTFYNRNRARVFGRYPKSNISDFENFSRLKTLILTPFEPAFERLSDHLNRSCRNKLAGGVLAPDTFCLVSHWRVCRVQISLAQRLHPAFWCWSVSQSGISALAKFNSLMGEARGRGAKPPLSAVRGMNSLTRIALSVILPRNGDGWVCCRNRETLVHRNEWK